MRMCPTCEHALSLPPSINYILTNFSDSVTPFYEFNRRIPRCKHCDLMAANKKAMDAELPPPTYENPVKQIEKHMEEAKRLIEEGIRKEEMEAALVRMRERLREVVKVRDRRIRKAWEEYWGIWGPEESGIGALFD